MTTETPTYIVKPAAERGARMPVIGPYPTREAAVAAATPNDYVISTEADVIFTGALLVEVYCAVTGLYVKKFETLDAGRRRLVTQLARYATPPDPETPSRAVNPETGKREGESDMPMTDAKVALANEKKAARETAKAAREAAKPPRTPREVKLGAFAQIRPATTLGSLAMVLVNGPKSTDDLAAEISSTAEKVVSTLKRARVTHGIDHRIEDGVVTLVLPVGISAENLFKTPKEKPASNGDRAPVAKIADAATIAVLAEKNPKREGTKAYSAFSLYRDGMTCAEFIAAGGSKADLSWDRSHGFISISEAA